MLIAISPEKMTMATYLHVAPPEILFLITLNILKQ